MPHYHAVGIVKEPRAVVVILQLLLDFLQRSATLGRVRFVHEQVLFALLKRRHNLAKAVARAKVCPHMDANTGQSAGMCKRP
eukprot:5934517-Prymnesium_polylepis.1